MPKFMSNMTAVEFIDERLKNFSFSSLTYDEIIQQAKEIEKKQIEDAYWDDGQDMPLTEKRCEQYYNETFKNK